MKLQCFWNKNIICAFFVFLTARNIVLSWNGCILWKIILRNIKGTVMKSNLLLEGLALTLKSIPCGIKINM